MDLTQCELTHPKIKEAIDACKNGESVLLSKEGELENYLEYVLGVLQVMTYSIENGLKTFVKVQEVKEEDLFNL